MGVHPYKMIILPEFLECAFFPQSLWLLLEHVWVFLLLTSLLDERLSKHWPHGLLIFIIHTSCQELFSRIGWDCVNSWKNPNQKKKNKIMFIYKNREDNIWVLHAPSLTFDDVRNDIAGKQVLVVEVAECVISWLCLRLCKARHVDRPEASWAALFIPFSPQIEFLSRYVIVNMRRSICVNGVLITYRYPHSRAASAWTCCFWFAIEVSLLDQLW